MYSDWTATPIIQNNKLHKIVRILCLKWMRVNDRTCILKLYYVRS